MPASGVLFQGSYIKTLKDQLKLRDTARILTGTQDPRVTATEAETGSLLLQQGSGGKLFLKNDNGSTTNWTLITAGISEDSLNILETIKNHLNNSVYKLTTPNIVGLDGDDLVATFGGTATYDIPNESLSFPAINDSITSVNLLDEQEFINNDEQVSDIGKILVSLFWKPTAIDAGATIEISRNGGLNYYEIDTSRIGVNSEVFEGEYEWNREEEVYAADSFTTDDTSTPLTDLAGTTEILASRFIFAVGELVNLRLRSVTAKLSRLGSPSGNYRFVIYNDASGSPGSTLYFSSWRSVAAVPLSATFIEWDLSEENIYLSDNTTYYLGIETDDAYKASYLGGANLRWHRSSGSGSGAFSSDAGVWSPIASSQFCRHINYAYERFESLLSDIAASTAELELNATTQQQISREITVPSGSVLVVKRAMFRLKRTGTVSGNIFYKLVRDNGSGLPSTNEYDVLAVSESVPASSIATSNEDKILNFGNTVLNPGIYHLVLASDSGYKSSYVAATNYIGIQYYTGSVITATGLFNGTSWSEGTNTIHLVYEVEGRTLDLRLRITSSQINRLLHAFSVFYKPEMDVAAGIFNYDVKKFMSASENLNSFDINFLPDPNLLEVQHVETGQVYVYPKFRISGNLIVFDANTFLSYPDTEVTLKFVQRKGTSFDNSDQNANNIAELDWINTWTHVLSSYQVTYPRQKILANSSSGAYTITLPANPSTGDEVWITDPTGHWPINNITVHRNGKLINGVAANLILNMGWESVRLVYGVNSWSVQ